VKWLLLQQLDSPVMWDVASRLMVLYGKTFLGSDGAKAAHWYRMPARLGDEPLAVQAQDAAAASLSASMPRFATHLELQRGLMLARAGDQGAGPPTRGPRWGRCRRRSTR
jgi:hypothetical protein